jgi:hypothetical protein
MGFRSPGEYWRTHLQKGTAEGKVFGQNIGAWVKIAASASYLVAAGFSLGTGWKARAFNDKNFAE